MNTQNRGIAWTEAPDVNPRAPMQKIVSCLWFNGNADAATQFHVTLPPYSRMDRLLKSSPDTPNATAGMVRTTEFTLADRNMTHRFPSLKPCPAISVA